MLAGPWVEHLISSGGPDVMFTITELDNNPQTVEVIASQFFANPGMCDQKHVSDYEHSSFSMVQIPILDFRA